METVICVSVPYQYSSLTPETATLSVACAEKTRVFPVPVVFGVASVISGRSLSMMVMVFMSVSSQLFDVSFAKIS